MAEIHDLCSKLLPRLAKKLTQTFKDHSKHHCTKDGFFDYTGKRFANKIKEFKSFSTFITIIGIPCYMRC